MSVDLPSSTLPQVLKRRSSMGGELGDRQSEIGDRSDMILGREISVRKSVGGGCPQIGEDRR